MKNLCVIPARGGSKRIPRKNIRDFCGKPMIARSIEVAQATQCFDRIIVSTDDKEIAALAKDWGAEIPFWRPPELADDFAGTTEVIAHAVQWVIDHGESPEAVCCIYATAPFLRPADLLEARAKLASSDWEFCFSATEYPSPIFRSFRQLPDGGVEMFFPTEFSKRSQDLPTALHDAGQFYWGRPEAWLGSKRIFDPHSTPWMLPRLRVVDIDTEEDWRTAEMLHEVLGEKMKSHKT